MPVSGLNHITLGVIDLSRSIRFYHDVLGFRVRAQWGEGAYLEAGALWLCLSLDDTANPSRRSDYTHTALDVEADAFEALSSTIREHAPLWKENTSEGDSLYFLDPDGHKLEVHVGSLETRLAHYRKHPKLGRIIFDP